MSPGEENRHPHVFPTVDPCHHATPLVMTLFQVGETANKSFGKAFDVLRT